MKSYLVLETPKTCGGCPCMNVMSNGFVCQEEWRNVEDPDHVPMWCPLKPLPNKKPVSYHDDIFGEVEKNFRNIGWNDCLEEIENE
jgi:hypothetical protein